LVAPRLAQPNNDERLGCNLVVRQYRSRTAQSAICNYLVHNQATP